MDMNQSQKVYVGGRQMGRSLYYRNAAFLQANEMKKDGFSDDQIRAFLHSVEAAIFDPKNAENDSEFGEKESA